MTTLLLSPFFFLLMRMRLQLLVLLFFSSCLLLCPNADAFQNVVVTIVVGQHDALSKRRRLVFHDDATITGSSLSSSFLKLSSITNDSHDNDKQDQDDDTEPPNNLVFRFLGRGENTIIRPGCVLVAPSNEYHTFYRRSAIFIYGMGPEDNTKTASSSTSSSSSSSNDDDGAATAADYLIRGLIIDYPTPFTLAEMMNHNPSMVQNPLGNNFLFRGGDKGGDGVILLHNNQNGNSTEIGTSGIYQGGWDAALEACQTAAAATTSSSSSSSSTPTTTIVDNYKAFFNYCEFTEKELSDMLDSRGGEEGGNDANDDAWMSVEVEADFVLNQDWDRGDAWTRLRNAVRQQEEKLLLVQQQQQQQQQQSNSGDGAGAGAGGTTEDFS